MLLLLTLLNVSLISIATALQSRAAASSSPMTIVTAPAWSLVSVDYLTGFQDGYRDGLGCPILVAARGMDSTTPAGPAGTTYEGIGMATTRLSTSTASARDDTLSYLHLLPQRFL